MKKIIIFIIFVTLSLNTLFSQTITNSIIVNNKSDVVKTVKGKIISFYIKGLSTIQINEFSTKIDAISGVELHFLKITDTALKMAQGKIQVDKNHDNKAVEILLKKYNITQIVFNGKPSTIEEFFNKKTKEKGRVVAK